MRQITTPKNKKAKTKLRKNIFHKINEMLIDMHNDHMITSHRPLSKGKAYRN